MNICQIISNFNFQVNLRIQTLRRNSALLKLKVKLLSSVHARLFRRPNLMSFSVMTMKLNLFMVLTPMIKSLKTWQKISKFMMTSLPIMGPRSRQILSPRKKWKLLLIQYGLEMHICILGRCQVGSCLKKDWEGHPKVVRGIPDWLDKKVRFLNVERICYH